VLAFLIGDPGGSAPHIGYHIVCTPSLHIVAPPMGPSRLAVFTVHRDETLHIGKQLVGL
jgi:hypothetical protein